MIEDGGHSGLDMDGAGGDDDGDGSSPTKSDLTKSSGFGVGW